jgi:hypothetical protein
VTSLSAGTTPAIGKYILSLQSADSTNEPGTNGYAALSVGNGALSLSGALPDNTTFAQSITVSKDGVWPVYAVPAGDGARGLLLGWETNDITGNCTGQLFWYKGSNVGAYYRSGVGVTSNMVLNSIGTNFIRPVSGSQYSIVFSGGIITPPLTNTLTVNRAGQFVVSGAATDKLKISLSANGVLTGSIVNSAHHKTFPFKGAFLSPARGGSGFIPEGNGQTGSFDISLVP